VAPDLKASPQNLSSDKRINLKSPPATTTIQILSDLILDPAAKGEEFEA
jgi:hypothetical protein